MQVRLATEADIVVLARLRVALLEETGASMSEHERTEMQRLNEDFFLRQIRSQEWCNWLVVAADHAVAVGTLAFFMRPPYVGNPQGKEAYFLNTYTLPAHRRRGAAQLILQAAIQRASELGVRKLILHATEAGRPMYSKAGFVPSAAYMELNIAAE
ncbi:MAG: GNAT family N-acetyltransferase [Burkholderiales bacterium]|jgi:GNAT superfamily N-acetyltransferase|nr:GNAT family N-acetyltransferase [Burkholderiales bacterium]